MTPPTVTHQQMREMQVGPVKVLRWKMDKRNHARSSLHSFETAEKALAWLRHDIQKFRDRPRDPNTGGFEGRPAWRVIADGDITVLRVNEHGIEQGLWT